MGGSLGLSKHVIDIGHHSGGLSSVLYFVSKKQYMETVEPFHFCSENKCF